jgi:hypothetical protein
MFEFVYRASGKQRPKTLYGFVIVTDMPSLTTSVSGAPAQCQQRRTRLIGASAARCGWAAYSQPTGPVPTGGVGGVGGVGVVGGGAG